MVVVVLDVESFGTFMYITCQVVNLMGWRCFVFLGLLVATVILKIVVLLV